MSEKAIAEIIGWEWRGHRVHRHRYSDAGHAYDHCVHCGRSPSAEEHGDPDVPLYFGPESGRGMWAPPGVEVMDIGCWPGEQDMIDWLLVQEPFAYDSEFNTPLHILGRKGRFTVVLCDREGDEVDATGDTLQAALEELVRVIDRWQCEQSVSVNIMAPTVEATGGAEPIG